MLCAAMPFSRTRGIAWCRLSLAWWPSLGWTTWSSSRPPTRCLVAEETRPRTSRRSVDRLRPSTRRVTLVHRRVYRPWGWYESIDEGPRFQVKRLMVIPGGKHEPPVPPTSGRALGGRAGQWLRSPATDGCSGWKRTNPRTSPRALLIASPIRERNCSRSSRCSRVTISARTISSGSRTPMEERSSSRAGAAGPERPRGQSAKLEPAAP